jgi:hypothetical protein
MADNKKFNMQNITIEVQPRLAKKIDAFLQYFGSKDMLFDQFIEYHIRKIKREISGMQVQLDKYEQKYQITSEVFYQKFSVGELGDEDDFMMWAGIYELQTESKNKLSKLL